VSTSFAGGGSSNVAKSTSDVVVGGTSNTTCGTCFNAIVGGTSNSIKNASLGSSIVGGQSNHICPTNCGNANYSTIAGGCNNALSGACGFIAGGCSNVIKGIHSSAAITTSCITSVSSNMLHASSLYLKTLPTSDPGVAGVLYRSGCSVRISL